MVSLASGFFGCSNTREVPIRQTSEGTFFEERKAPVSFPGSVVWMKDSAMYEAEEIQLDSAHVSWSASGTTRTVPLDSVDRIVGTNIVLGAAEGLGLGYLLGIIPGAIAGEIADPADSDDWIPGWLAGAAIGSATGALIGAVYGGIVGHEYTIIFSRNGDAIISGP
jgi:outer membrane lipoprotein SlyB